MTFNSYAKINIGLKILNKRNDGFHELETIFQQIDLKDDIEIKVVDNTIELTCEPVICPQDKRNLAYQAAQKLKDNIATKLGCKIHINKRIPVGAGLGGGSSNAAITLTALNQLWDAKLTRKELATLAADIGSDVPFFIYGGTAFGAGRGELITPITHATDFFGVLVCPDFSISTKWAYQQLNFSLTKTRKKSNFHSIFQNFLNTGTWKKELVNDLESVVFEKYPILENIISSLYEFGAFFSQMSGSGSSIFGLFSSLQEASLAREELEKKFKTFLFQPIIAN